MNEAFVGKFHKRFGTDYPNITELAMGTYQGFRLWAEAVKKSGRRTVLLLLSDSKGGLRFVAVPTT